MDFCAAFFCTCKKNEEPWGAAELLFPLVSHSLILLLISFVTKLFCWLFSNTQIVNWFLFSLYYVLVLYFSFSYWTFLWILSHFILWNVSRTRVFLLFLYARRCLYFSPHALILWHWFLIDETMKIHFLLELWTNNKDISK